MEAIFIIFKPYVVALHIIFVVSWFSGLFYNIRLFIYWTEAQEKKEPEKSILSRQYLIMSSRLWHIITLPSAFITLFFGLYLYTVWVYPNWNHRLWLDIKILLVLILYAYNFYFYKMHKQMVKGVFRWSAMALRYWNEVATLLLFSIVFLVILKDSVDMIKGVLLLFSLGILLAVIIQKYKKYRDKKSNEN